MNKAVIVAQGEVNNLCELKKSTENSYLLCADGAIEHLFKLNIIPNVWIGDFDSFDAIEKSVEFDAYIKKVEETAKKITLNPIKDETDFETICNYVIDKLCPETVEIFGATGKRLDHTLSNIMALKKFYDAKTDACILDGYNKIQIFKGEKKVCKNPYKYLSIIPFEEKNCIFAEGVKYPVKGECLNPFLSRGISNEIVDDFALIKSDVYTLLIYADDKCGGK